MLNININDYNKILVYQFGKVGSSTLTYNNNGKFYPKIKDEYLEKVIHTHTHEVAEDILKKYNNVLVINIVRLPIGRNISAFWEDINVNCTDYKYKTIIELDNLMLKHPSYDVKSLDWWMNRFYETTGIDYKNFSFDFEKKFVCIDKKSHKFLFYRFEDIDYINSIILPSIGFKFDRKEINDSNNKHYKDFYKNHKKYHKVSKDEIENIKNSVYVKIFYTPYEIINHISDWS